jgi:hypothetical protein
MAEPRHALSSPPDDMERAIARSSGAGFGLGIGRGGSLIAPILAGLLFQRGHTLAGVSTIMALGSLIGAAAVFTLSLPTHLDR